MNLLEVYSEQEHIYKQHMSMKWAYGWTSRF